MRDITVFRDIHGGIYVEVMDGILTEDRGRSENKFNLKKAASM